MPGPKMGPRPADFDESHIRQSPTYHKWARLGVGEKLRYACREFIKGHGDDEERLMRRIMIARRNNLRDHETLKRARNRQHQREPIPQHSETSLMIKEEDTNALVYTQDTSATAGRLHGSTGAHIDPSSTPLNVTSATNSGLDCNGDHLIICTESTSSNGRKRRPASMFSDAQVATEMDVQAVEATRSYRTWLALPNGSEFLYNQKYIKGRDGHDWLLRKNIWRRMRYRRENKKMVERMKQQSSTFNAPPAFQSATVAGGSAVAADQRADSASRTSATDKDAADSARTPPSKTAAAAKPRSSQVSAVDVPENSGEERDLGSISVKQEAGIADTLLSSQAPAFPESSPTTTAAAAANAAAVMAAVAAASSAQTSDLETAAAVEAACAVAESYAKNTQNVASGAANSSHPAIRDSLETATSAANPAALDAAARLAAVTTSPEEDALASNSAMI